MASLSPDITEALIATAGLALMALAWWAFALRPRAALETGDGGAERHVHVHGGYDPPEVHVPAGVPTRVVFFRDETAPCSERVVFPDFGLNVGLPAFREIAVDLPASVPGRHPFTCEMEMLRGELVVDPPQRTPGRRVA